MDRHISHRGALGVGLGASAIAHVAMIAAYGAFMSNPVASEDPVSATPAETPPPALEVVRLPDGPPAPAAPSNTVLGSTEASEPVASPRSPRTVRAMLTENPTAAELAPRMAEVAAPMRAELTALPAQAVNTRAGQVDAPTGADGWFPGKYTMEHEDHEHPVVDGVVLGIGPTCGFSGVYTSVNRRSPFGG